MKYKIQISIFIIVTLFAVSCKENADFLSSVDSSISTDSTKTINRIKLENNQELVTIMDRLDNGVELSDLVNVSNFESMWDVYSKIINSNSEDERNKLISEYPNIVTKNDDNELVLNLSDKTLAKVLTPDGFIQVGNQIIKMQGDEIKVIKNGDESLISLLTENNPDKINSNIEVKEIVKFDSKGVVDADGREKSNVAEWSGYKDYDSKTRCHWKKWLDYNPVFDYASIGAYIYNEEKKWLGWLSWYKCNMYLYIHSNELTCGYAFFLGGLNDDYTWSQGPGYYTNIDHNQRFNGNPTGAIKSGEVDIKFMYRGTWYEE